MKLVIGLGNHGATYAHTRHNMGWDVATALAQSLEALFVEKTRFFAEVAEARVGETKVLFVHPLTYVNRSGDAALALMQFYKIDLADILVVQDEMDYVLGQLRFCVEGGAAGHNGIVSIQQTLATTNIQRLRVGIGRSQEPLSKEAYVLQPFLEEEKDLVAKSIERAKQAARDWIQNGAVNAMNRWNQRQDF